MSKRIVLIYLFWILFIGQTSFASAVLENIEASQGDEIRISFSEKIDREKVKTEFNEEFVQLVINDVTIYPSKIVPVNGNLITKVFAYQFSPKQVRCRFSMSGKSEELKKKFIVDVDGNILSIKYGSNQNVVTPELSKLSNSIKAPYLKDELDEEKLLEKVIKTSAAHPEQNPPSTQHLTGNKTNPSMTKAMLKVFGVLLLFCSLGLFLKKLKNSKWALSHLKRGVKNNGTVEILSTHYLGPKKSLTLVKIAGRILVLGVTDASIQMITELQDSKENATGEDQDPAFSDLLGSENLKPNVNMSFSGVRSKIRSRLEGLKEL